MTSAGKPIKGVDVVTAIYWASEPWGETARAMAAGASLADIEMSEPTYITEAERYYERIDDIEPSEVLRGR